MNYTATHVSIQDGSPAMEVDLGPGLYLMNEDGFEWQADPAEWREISQLRSCQHCGRSVLLTGDHWVDPFALDDDAIWRETCDDNDTERAAPHEPVEA